MSSRLTQLLLALSLLLNCFALAGFVYRSWIAPPHMLGQAGRPPPPPGPNRWTNPLEALAFDLKLDDGATKELQPIFEQYGTLRRDRSRDIGKLREAMSAELQKPQFDMAKLDTLVDQMSVLRAEQQKQNLRAIEQMAAKLKPDHQAELHKILAERYGGSWRSGGTGGPRGPRPPQ
ncbi:MAG TPA: periplasmic heavy metal sensor [Reyranella sp.]|nr:periplasmic heavy metal sensor [Reyranella sp.]